jgi:hypothetical protein
LRICTVGLRQITTGSPEAPALAGLIDR